MRKILYSPGYGAGWTTWGGDTPEQKRFMLEYQPFIEWLERGNNLRDDPEQYAVVQQFLQEWAAMFPGVSTPYLGGLRDLQVAEVSGRVRIHEYDGFESIEEEGEFNGWL